MNQATIQGIFTLFKTHGIRKLDKLRLYIHAVIVLHVMEQHAITPRETWEHPAAAALREYLPTHEAVDKERAILLAELIGEIDPDTYFHSFLPDICPGNPVELFTGRIGVSATYDILAHSLIEIWAVVMVQRSLKWQPYPDGFQSSDFDRLSALLFAAYKDWKSGHPQYENLQFSQENFFDTWVLIYGVPYRRQPISTKGKLVKTLTALRKEGCPDEVILQCYFIAKTEGQLKPRSWEIVSPVNYFRRVFLRDMQDAGSPADESGSPGIDYFRITEELQRCMEDWKKTPPLDFLRVLYYLDQLKEAADIMEAENALVRARLRMLRFSPGIVLLFEPNPDLIAYCVENSHPQATNLLFVLSSHTLAQVCKQSFPNGTFGYYSRTLDGKLKISVIVRDARHRGKDIFLEKPLQERGHHAFLFVRQATHEGLASRLKRLAEDHLVDNASVTLLAPHSVLNQDMRHVLERNYRIQTAIFLPNSKSKWLKKQLFLSMQVRSGNNAAHYVRTFGILRYDNGCGDVFLCREPWPVDIPRELWLSEKTLHGQRAAAMNRNLGKARKTRCLSFSPEIKLWYSWSKGRGHYYFCKCPTEKQLRVSPFLRGESLTKHTPFNAKTLERAQARLEARICQEPLKSTIQKEIKRAYRNKPISLKSFWFCNMEEISQAQQYSAEIMQRLFTSRRIAEIRSDQEVTLEEYKQIMERDFPECSKKEALLLWRQLNLLLSTGAAERRFMPSPISAHVQSLTERDVGYQQVRKSLAKRTYELDEEKKMLRFLSEQLPEKGVHIGCAISFFTGMGTSEIAALTWNDYRFFQYNEGKQFMVYQYLHPEKGICRFPTDKPNAYRRIPVVDILAKWLDQRREYVKEKLVAAGCSDPESAIAALPIVTQDDAGFSVFCKPDAIRAAKAEVEAAAQIPSLEGLVENEETKGTDFNAYHADRFRANFRYRAMQSSMLTKAELHYILGISMPTTFSRHYCDYTNDLAQIALAKKLERWARLHMGSPRPPAEQTIQNPAPDYNLKLAGPYERMSVELDLDIQAKKGQAGKITFEIADGSGVNIDLVRLPLQ